MKVGQETRELGSWKSWHTDDQPIRVGASTCLLGEEVRFDGGHARSRFVTDVLGAWVEWVPVCPEVEIGMGIPRPSVRLVEDEHDEGRPRLVEPKTGRDYSDEMRSYAARKAKELEAIGLDGYVLKKNSPSCGMERVKVYGAKSVAHKNGVGLFVEVLAETAPHLPLEEDGRLNDPPLRENFIERIFARNRWRTLVRRGLDRRSLVGFHTAHKLLLWSHSEAGMRRMGRMVGQAGEIDDRELFERYEEEFQLAMRRKAARKQHTNVLQHAMGHLKDRLDARDKREILTAIEDYRLGLLPLIVPVTLLRFNIHKYEVDYLIGQLYFDPHPKELLLRNHV